MADLNQTREGSMPSNNALNKLKVPKLSSDQKREILLTALEPPRNLLSDVTSWHGHTPFAHTLVKLLKPQTIVELGVHKGDSCLTFANSLIVFKVKGKIFGIDTWQGDEQAGFYEGEKIFEEVSKTASDFNGKCQLIRSLFDDALEKFYDKSVDVLHIDGLHTYEAVKHDHQSWARKLAPCGVVLFHDTMVTHSSFEVYKYWDEISEKAVSFNFPQSNGLGVLVFGHTKLAKSVGGQLFLSFLKELSDENSSFREHFLSIAKGNYAQSVNTFFTQELGRVNKLSTDLSTHLEKQNKEIDELRARNDDLQSNYEDLQSVYTDTEQNRQRLEIECSELESSFGLIADEVSKLNAHNIEVIEQHFGPQPKQSSNFDNLKREDLSIEERLEHIKIRRENISLEFSTVDHGLTHLDNALFLEKHRFKPFKSMAKAGLATLKYGKSTINSAINNGTNLVRRGLDLCRTGFLISGREAINALPVSNQRKVRIKQWGRVRLGINRRKLVQVMSGGAEIALIRLPTTRYLPLSRQATSAPANLAERSVSIIIPVYNQLSYTLRCIKSIQENTTGIEYEIIVINDQSSDDTETLLSNREDIRFHTNPENLGFIGSCNQGARMATNEYICYLNNDTVVAPTWMDSLLDSFELYPNLGLVGSKLIYPNGQLQEAGGLIWDDFSGWNYGKFQDRDARLYSYARFTDYCSGAAIVIPAALERMLGGFDPHFSPAYGEDSDMAFRIRSIGLSVLYQPLSNVYHFEGITSGTDETIGVKAYQVENAKKLAKRWAPVLPFQGESGQNLPFVADRGTLGNILVIDEITPQTDCDAGSLTAFEIMRSLRDFGYKVSFVPQSNYTYINDYTDTLSAIGVESLLYPEFSNIDDVLKVYGSELTAVLIFRISVADQCLASIKKSAPNAKVIFHASDLHFLRMEREDELKSEKTDLRRERLTKETKQKEIETINTVDLTIVHSQFEVDLINEIAPEAKVVNFPWIYEARAPEQHFEEQNGLVFVGGYRHGPNIDAVDYFTDEILPILRDKGISDTFHIIGSHPPERFKKLEAEDSSLNVHVHGFVEDLEHLICDMRVMVVPLRFGAGLKGKIVTALAHGIPVVTTSIGAEGINLTDGKNIIIADTAEEFASAVERLTKDKSLWNSIRAAGLEFVNQTTSRHAGNSILQGILEELKLPHLPQRFEIGSNDSDENSQKYSCLQGSPSSIYDVGALVDAIKNSPANLNLTSKKEPNSICISDGLAAVISDQAKARTGSLPTDFSTLSTLLDAGITTNSKGTDKNNLLFIANMAQPEETISFVNWIEQQQARLDKLAIVFLPPPLVVSDGHYKSATDTDGTTLSVSQEVMRDALDNNASKIGGNWQWTCDIHLLGFPSVMIAHWQN
ncbi:MAG: glycosyltransferase [Pseudomonadota bacterium]